MRGISNADYNYIEEQIEKYIDEGDHTEEEIEAKRRDLEEECFFTDDEEEVADALEDAGCSLMKFVRYDGVGNRYIRYGIDDRSGYLVGCIGDVGEMTLEEIREWMNQGEDLEEEQDNKDYIYYFYYHMTMSTAEILKIEECIKDHDFDAFLQFYYKFLTFSQLLSVPNA